MNLDYSNNAAQTERKSSGVHERITAGAECVIDRQYAWAEKQHEELQRLLDKEPALASLIFQGRSLAELASPAGLRALRLAIDRQDYDRISLNHGIHRLRLDDYDGEIIWDYPGKQSLIVESDAITRKLERNAELIIRETLGCIAAAEKFPDSDSLTNTSGLWSYRSFYDKSGKENPALRSACPGTASLIRGIRPNLMFGFAFISMLDPNTTIAPHRGSTSLRQRYHLGVRIPVDGTSRIRIGNTWRNWHEGKAFGFNDAVEHEVEHWSLERRVVLIVDTWSDHVPADVIKGITRNTKLLKLAVMADHGDSIAMND